MSPLKPIFSKSDSATKEKKRAKFLNVYNFIKKDAQESKGQLLEHCRIYAIETAKRVAEAAKFFRKTIREILGDQAQRPY
jgi:hypothetical protein